MSNVCRQLPAHFDGAQLHLLLRAAPAPGVALPPAAWPRRCCLRSSLAISFWLLLVTVTPATRGDTDASVQSYAAAALVTASAASMVQTANLTGPVAAQPLSCRPAAAGCHCGTCDCCIAP